MKTTARPNCCQRCRQTAEAFLAPGPVATATAASDLTSVRHMRMH